MSRRDPSEWPYYGPHGDPDSADPFERAQARMPEGWHVEGQVVYGKAMATHINRTIAPVIVWGTMQGWGVLDDLVKAVAERDRVAFQDVAR